MVKRKLYRRIIQPKPVEGIQKIRLKAVIGVKKKRVVIRHNPGATVRKRRIVGQRYEFTYSDVQYDKEDWADFPLFFPMKCDLVVMKVKRAKNGNTKNVNGWWNGHGWEGLHLHEDDEVLTWKRSKEEF